VTRYASNTTVSSDQSRSEIERTLQRYGANKFGYLWEGKASVIVFEMNGRRIKFVLPMPARDDPKYGKTPTGRVKRNQEAHFKAWEQDCRSRWRALLLCIKAKLESVESDIESFEEAFLPHIVLPNGQTAGEHLIPQIADIYQTRKMPKMLMESGR